MANWDWGFYPAIKLAEEHGALHFRLKSFRDTNAFLRTNLKDDPGAAKAIEAVTKAAKSGSDKDRDAAREVVLALLVKHGLAVR